MPESSDFPDWSGLLTILSTQPPEIITRIFEQLGMHDLLALRHVNHAWHTIVHQHERDLCTSTARRLLGHHPLLRLSVRVHGPPNNLIYRADLQQRARICYSLSELLVHHLISYLQYVPINDKVLIEAMRTQKKLLLQRSLFPAIFALNNFLESMRMVVIEGENQFATWDDDVLMAATDIFMLDQQQIIQELCQSAESLKDLAAAWLILQGVCKARRLGLSLRSPSYPFATLKRILLYGGLSPMRMLLTSSEDVAVRRNLLEQASATLHSETRTLDRPPLSSIHHLNVHRNGFNPVTLRSYRVSNKFIDNQDILSRAAFAVLQRIGEADNINQFGDSARWVASKICVDGEDAAHFSMHGWSTPR